MRLSRWIALLFLFASAAAVASVPTPKSAPADTLAEIKSLPSFDAVDAAIRNGFTVAVGTNPVVVHMTSPGDPVLPGGFADVSIDVPKSASVVWRISPAPVQRAKNLPSNRLIFGGVQGTTYTVTAIVVDFDAKTVTDTDTTVEFGGKKDDDIPDPKPKPDPKPEPDGTITHFVVAEDTTQAGSWRGDILGSPAVAKFYQQLQGTRSGPIHALVDVKAGLSDPVSKKYTALATGKKLPYIWMLDGPPATGKVLREKECPIDSPESFIAAFDLHKDTPRAMGLIIEAPKLKWVKFGSTPQVPLIPRDQWKPVNLSAFLPPVYDQDGVGQCASSACCSTIETAARIAGKQFPKLSAGDLYGRPAVNGGRDRGSLLEDNLAEAMNNGVAPASMVPYVWDGKMNRSAAVIAERKKYRVIEAYWCENFDAMASALQQGFVLEHGLMWRDNFRPDAEGWLPSRGSGSAGGHAEMGYGLAQRNGVWGIRTRNSWGPSWGVAGDSIIPESLFDGNIGGFFAIRVVSEPTAKRDPFKVFDREFALAP